MEVTENTYELLVDKLLQIENTASCGIVEGHGNEACLAIRTLVFDMRQILVNEFYPGGDEPPAA